MPVTALRTFPASSAETRARLVRTTQRHIREIFLLQLAIVCLVVVLCVLGVQAMYGASAMSWLTVAALVIALGATISVTCMG